MERSTVASYSSETTTLPFDLREHGGNQQKVSGNFRHASRASESQKKKKGI